MEQVNEATDLVLDRVLDAARDRVWRAWTDPEQLKQWWCPRPWTTPEAVIDLRPGGRFYTRMAGPNGEGASGGEGCFLEVVRQERLVWTSALMAGFRPAGTEGISCGEDSPVMAFTAVVTFEEEGEGRTRYRAHVMHATEADRDAHERMGFHDGWGAAAKQLEELAGA
jgi:uncharacterized protein YndB with AHSA1/START domain